MAPWQSVDPDALAVRELVARARAGDATAFGGLFDHYHVRVHRYIASRLDRRADAEDLTQAVFVRALEALPRYEDRGIPFGAWLFRLARNAVIDFRRTHRDHLDLDGLEDAARSDPGPDQVVAARQEFDAIGLALGRLTDEQRDAIALRFFAGLSAREAAHVMGKQEGTVRGLQFRAIAALRRELGIDEVQGPAEGASATVERAGVAFGRGIPDLAPMSIRERRRQP